MEINNLGINSYKYVNFKGAEQKQQENTNSPEINIYQTSPITPVYTPITLKGPEKIGEVSIPYAKKAQVYKLANGQTAVILNKKGPTTINTYVKVGSFNEPDNIRGISHFIEHNLFNGSKELKPNQFVTETHKMGAIYNASTGFASTNYFLTSPVHSQKDFDKMIKMHADMLENPQFAPTMLTKEKDIVSSEIQMLEDMTYQKVENLMLKNLFQINTDSTDLIGGKVQNIQSLNRNTVEDFYNTYYTPDNMITVVVGNVNPDEVANKLNRNFISRKKSSNNKKNEFLNPISSQHREDIKLPQISSCIVGMAFAGPQNNDTKKQIAKDALLYIMTNNKNSPFYKEMDSLNTFANASSEIISNDKQAYSSIAIIGNFQEGTEENGLQAMQKGIEKMKTTLISEKDLKDVKQKLKNDYIQLSESSMSLSNLIGMTSINNSLEDIQKNHDTIDTLTSQDIQNAAKEFLNTSKSSIVIAHPQNHSKTQNTIHSDVIDNLNLGKTENTSLKNNIKAVYHTNDAPFAYSTLTIKNPNKSQYIPGTELILSSILNKGSTINPKEKFDEKTAEINSDINFEVNGDKIITNLIAPQNKFAEGVNLVQEVLFNPDFSQENFEKSKEKITIIAKQLPKQSENKAVSTLYPNDITKISPEDMLKTLDKIKLEDVKNLYFDIINNAQARTVISASEASKTKNLEAFQNIPLNFKKYEQKFIEDNTPITQNKVITQEEDIAQADITQAFKLSTNGDIKEIASLMIMNTIIQEGENGLFNDLREKQKLCYTVKSRFINEEKTPHLVLKIKTTTEDTKSGFVDYKNIEKSLTGFKKHINKMINTPVDEEDLKNAKLKLITNLAFAIEGSQEQHAIVDKSQDTTLNNDYIPQLYQTILTISPEDIQKTAQKNLKNPSVISIIANKNSLEANKEFLTNLQNNQ